MCLKSSSELSSKNLTAAKEASIFRKGRRRPQSKHFWKLLSTKLSKGERKFSKQFIFCRKIILALAAAAFVLKAAACFSSNEISRRSFAEMPEIFPMLKKKMTRIFLLSKNQVGFAPRLTKREFRPRFSPAFSIKLRRKKYVPSVCLS